MQKIIIRSKLRNYQVKFTNNFNFLRKFFKNNSVFIIDEKVYRLYKKKLFKSIKTRNLILVKAYESTKTLEGANKIYNCLIKKNAKRNLLLIVIGGGVIQDIAGFVAATIYRGINWIYVPTTLLAQTDSCIGSKTSINFNNFKNVIGMFYPPNEVYICPNFLETLLEHDFVSGLGEIIKLHLAAPGKKNLEFLSKKIEFVKKTKSISELLKLTYDSLKIKKDYIESDEFDLGKRTLLNYGHTLGHALESSSNFRLPHGTAIIIGMIFANLLALKRKLISAYLFRSLNQLIFLPNIEEANIFKSYFDKNNLANLVKRDKKMTTAKLTFIIPDENLNLVKIKDITYKEFYWALNELRKILNLRGLNE